MNELKILITASTSAAKKAVKEVRDEIDKVNKSAKENGKSITESMKAVAKSAAIAVGAITAITGAMAALGKSAQEVNKGIEKLNTAFKSAGSTSKQATDTYKQLFGIFGDHDRAIETAQSLARITTEADKLSEYYTILAGTVAKYGDGLNPEVLAESVSETIAEGKATGELVRVLVEAGVAEDAFNNSLAQTTSLEERETLVRNTLNNALGKTGAMYIAANQATIQYNQSQANLNLALAQAARYTTPFLTAINNLGATLLTSLAPALQTVTVYLTAFIQLMSAAIQWVGGFFGVFSKKTEKTTGDITGYKKAMDNYLNSLSGGFNKSGAGIDSNINKLKELKKQTMGFDELNVVSSPDAAAAGGGGGGGGASLGNLPPMPKPEDFGLDFDTNLEDLTKEIEEAKEKIKGILTLVGIVGGAFGLWKLTDFVKNLWDSYKVVKGLKDVNLDEVWNQLSEKEVQSYLHWQKMKPILQKIGGYMMIIAGAILLVQGYSDAWVNGVDWGNFAQMISGIGLIVGGLALAFGPVAAGVGAIVGGIALLVVGIKDLIENGYSMEAVLTILAGVLAIVVGVCLAFNVALLANPITWVIAGIAALVAAFVILWNECEGFRNFWIGLWENISTFFSAAWDKISIFFTKTIPEAFKSMMNWLKTYVCDPIAKFYTKWIKPVVDKLLEIVAKLVEMVGALFVGLWNLLDEKVISPIVEGFKFVWEKVSEYFTSLWEDIKAVWQKIKEVFAPVVTWFSEKFSAAWQAVKDVFSTWGSFFSGLWNTIKNTFSTLGTSIGNAISSAVKSGINGVISMIEKTINSAINLINGAIDLINKLPGVSVSKVNKLSLPRLAKGGVVDTATIAMIGEAGKEAVIPLENNTEWMDKLADRLAERSSTPSKIVLMLDKKELGWANIHSINDITKQTGSLPLAIV